MGLQVQKRGQSSSITCSLPMYNFAHLEWKQATMDGKVLLYFTDPMRSSETKYISDHLTPEWGKKVISDISPSSLILRGVMTSGPQTDGLTAA